MKIQRGLSLVIILLIAALMLPTVVSAQTGSVSLVGVSTHTCLPGGTTVDVHYNVSITVYAGEVYYYRNSTGYSENIQGPINYNGPLDDGVFPLNSNDRYRAETTIHSGGSNAGPIISRLLMIFDCSSAGSGGPSEVITQTGLPSVPDTDPDGDGISGSRDNCPYDYNPSQEDGWGSDAGDACDTEWYNQTGQGMSGFVQKNGLFNLHGNCIYLADGAPRCPVIASFDPSTFTPDSMPIDATTDDAGTWTVMIYYLHSNNGVDVYQVNTYSTNPPQPDMLVDDRLELHVSGSSWRWLHRGGMFDQ